MGFTNIHITGYDWFAGCPKDDFYVTGFTAIAPNGRVVRGAVCGNWFSDLVRFY
jgi:hypothetical protein